MLASKEQREDEVFGSVPQIIKAAITIDELKVRDEYIFGTLIADVWYDQNANNEQGYSYYPVKIITIDDMFYVGVDDKDHPAKDLFKPENVLPYLQVYAEKFVDNLSNKNVTEIL